MTKEQKILALKAELIQRAKRRWPTDEAHQNRYIYGTLRKVKERMSK